MTNHRTKLKNLLRELFQFDAADLDFGIYRIMNQRRAEIDDFIENGLLDAVAQEFTLLQEGVVEEKREELDRIALGLQKTYPGAIDDEGNLILPEQYMQAELPLAYKRVQEEIARATVSAEAEAEIFNALYTFFSRYYDRGDFITKRRYSRTHKYAVPYNGEEVLLHWANRDQYYVKTADTLTDYVFVIESHGGYRVRFKLAVADTEHGNVKGDKRYFFPVAEGTPSEYDEDKRELILFFEYHPLDDVEKTTYGRARIQEKIIKATRGRLLDAVPDATLRGLLATPAEGKEIPPLDLHLTRWTRKSTSDYFIHKGLRAFLERELDFYLKNEVMRLDDLDTENAARAERYLTRLVVIKRLARKVIAFLAQIEGFQKSLFEKPKFVLASEWCVTLDRVPGDLLLQVADNDAQWAEWQRLFGVQKPEGDEPELLAFLAEHPTLTVDTALYDVAFKDALLAALSVRDGGLETQRDGLLIHGENFQALNLLLPRYREQVRCIYIDPPYNAVATEIVYKNEYKDSSWLTLILDRLSVSRNLLNSQGLICVTIDDYELHRLKYVLDDVFQPENYLATVLIRNNPSGRSTVSGFAINHEYALFYSKSNDAVVGRLPHSREQIDRYDQVDENEDQFEWENFRKSSAGSERADRPKQFFPLYYNPSTTKLRVPQLEWQDTSKSWNVLEEPTQEELVLLPVVDEIEKVWNYGIARTRRDIGHMIVRDVGGKYEVYKRKYLRKEGTLPRTWWEAAKYSARDSGTRTLVELFGRKKLFDFPKSVDAVKDSLLVCSADSQATVLDYFAGSGTTAQAVIDLNREDNGERKYILVEIGGYFDTVLKPRVQKVTYAAEWKNGQPVEGSEGSSHAFQYLRLESYEDTLDNLDLEPEAAPTGLFPPERDDYLLRYFLDHETRQGRLNVESFATPFDYQLRVRRQGVETRVGVDLLETANFLLGLTVQARRAYEHQGRTYRAVFGTAGDQFVVVIWRDTAGLDLPAEAAFIQAKILRPPGSAETSEVLEPDRVYINGDSHVPHAQSIEAVFMNAMRDPVTAHWGGN